MLVPCLKITYVKLGKSARQEGMFPDSASHFCVEPRASPSLAMLSRPMDDETVVSSCLMGEWPMLRGELLESKDWDWLIRGTQKVFLAWTRTVILADSLIMSLLIMALLLNFRASVFNVARKPNFSSWWLEPHLFFCCHISIFWAIVRPRHSFSYPFLMICQ